MQMQMQIGIDVQDYLTWVYRNLCEGLLSMFTEHINWEMIAALTALLAMHGAIFLAAAKSVFITKKEHEILSRKIDGRLYKDGIPIYVPQTVLDRRITEDERHHNRYAEITCKKIDELRIEIKELRGSLSRNIATS